MCFSKEEVRLSKSKYCRGVQCPKMLWLDLHKKEEFDDSVNNEAVLEAGNEVGDLAMGLLGDFAEVPYGDPKDMAAKTAELMAVNTPIIAEASFLVDGLFCSVDILKRTGEKTVELYEVKSSTEVKDIYYHDVAYQCYVLKKAGYTVEGCYIVHINRAYVRGEELNIQDFFKIVNVTQEAKEMQEETAERSEGFLQIMRQDMEKEQELGDHCFKPYACGFFGYCTKALPKPNVFDLAGLQRPTKLKLYRENKDVPANLSFAALQNNKAMKNAKAKQQIAHALQKLQPEIDKAAIRGFLNELSYPMYFLDFETSMTAIPMFADSHPFDQIVFQYSLHYIEEEGGVLKHKEYLASPENDPRHKIAGLLCQQIPKDACVLAYNRTFEKTRLKELAEMYPEYADHLNRICENMKDLMVPFRDRSYYCDAMQGSYSIKYVLPALFPNDPALDYHNLEGVQEGGTASGMFAKMLQMNEEEVQTVREQLLAYCKLDTYAMVKIWEKLKEAVEEE